VSDDISLLENKQKKRLLNKTIILQYLSKEKEKNLQRSRIKVNTPVINYLFSVSPKNHKLMAFCQMHMLFLYWEMNTPNK